MSKKSKGRGPLYWILTFIAGVVALYFIGLAWFVVLIVMPPL